MPRCIKNDDDYTETIRARRPERNAGFSRLSDVKAPLGPHSLLSFFFYTSFQKIFSQVPVSVSEANVNKINSKINNTEYVLITDNIFTVLHQGKIAESLIRYSILE